MTPQLTTVYVPVGKGESIAQSYHIRFDNVYVNKITGYFLTPEEMEEVIRKAREQAIREAAEVATMTHWDGFWKVGKPIKYFQSGADNIQVDKESILNLLNKTK